MKSVWIAKKNLLESLIKKIDKKYNGDGNITAYLAEVIEKNESYLIAAIEGCYDLLQYDYI